MGNPLSPLLADFFMDKFESNVLEKKNQFIVMGVRYVDDYFVIGENKEAVEVLYQKLNSEHKNISLTREDKNGGSLPYLDILVEKEEGRFNTRVYRKPTAGDEYIHKNSGHPAQMKQNVWKDMFLRAMKLCNGEEALKTEVRQIIDTGEKNGYTKTEMIVLWKKVISKNQIQNKFATND